MTASIKTEYTLEVWPSKHGETRIRRITFYVRDVENAFAYLGEYHTWRMIGTASIHDTNVNEWEHPVIITPLSPPVGNGFPQCHVNNMSQANSFFEAYAEMWMTMAGIDAERRTWESQLEDMAEAEAAEARAHRMLAEG